MSCEYLTYFAVLTFSLDGGGVRGFSTLLIIQELMKLCKNIEQRENPDVDSSYHPIRFQETQASGLSRIPLSRFLPVHYFDYIGKESCPVQF